VSLRLEELHDPVIVTMATMRMVEVAADQIIRVVGVGNRLVPTARGVRVPLTMGVFAQPLERIYFRNTPAEWLGEPFRKCLMSQHLSDYARIESPDMP
jgi:hypothetical protein